METYEGFTIGDRVKFVDFDEHYPSCANRLGVVSSFSRPFGQTKYIRVRFDDNVDKECGGYDIKYFVKQEANNLSAEEDVTDALIWMLNNAPPWVCHRLAETMKKYKEQT